MQKITDNQISIIIQGKVETANDLNGKPITQSVIDSCRENFPAAEIILSTWSKDNFYLKNYDKIVLSEDPGDPTPACYKAANTGRQIVSSREGLLAATREFAIKTRTDLVFTHDKIFDYFYKYPIRDEEYLITENRVIVSNISSYKPNKRIRMPFHFCDFIFAGKRSDILSIFKAPIPSEKDYLWFMNEKRPQELIYFPNWVSRFSPESWLIINLVKQKFEVNIDNSFMNKNHEELMSLSNNVLISNFIILNKKQLGVNSLKNKLPFPYFCFCYLHKDWLNLYNNLSGKRNFYYDEEIIIKCLLLIRLNLKLILKKFLNHN